MTADNLLLDLAPREVEVIRLALRQAQEAHRSNGFLILAQEVMVLRSKISDAMLDARANGKPVGVSK
jgi:hypothetical protein